MALARLLATLHDADGSVAVEGVSSFDWGRLDFLRGDLRAGADLAEGVGVIGTGTIGSRLWSNPSINAIGLDMTDLGRSRLQRPDPRGQGQAVDADRARCRPRRGTGRTGPTS